MRHRVYGKHLGRNRNERENLFRGLIQSLFLHGTISLSSSKAKAIKGLVDKVINLAKDKRLDLLQTLVIDKSIREKLIKEILPKLGNKTSGFTSTVRMGNRLGDQTVMVRMSLIGAEKLEPPGKLKPSEPVGTKASKGEKEAKKKKLPKKKGRIVNSKSSKTK